MLTFVKGDAVKLIDPESSLIGVLKQDGWKVEGDQSVDDELEALRTEALALGLKVHHKAGADKIKAMIEEAQ